MTCSKFFCYALCSTALWLGTTTVATAQPVREDGTIRSPDSVQKASFAEECHRPVGLPMADTDRVWQPRSYSKLTGMLPLADRQPASYGRMRTTEP